MSLQGFHMIGLTQIIEFDIIYIFTIAAVLSCQLKNINKYSLITWLSIEYCKRASHYCCCCKWSNTTSATSGTGTANSSGAHEFSAVFFHGVYVARVLVFCIVFCRWLSFCHFFSFGHCLVCPLWTYQFWLPLWCLQRSMQV